MGLSVVDGIVKNHYGFVDVQSTLGEGTTFFLYFPISEEEMKNVDNLAEQGTYIQGGNETILFVEDEEGLLSVMRAELENHGYNVLTATDGMEALNMYRELHGKISLVVTDMGLPKLSGDQMFFKMHTINPSVKAILLSGYLDPNLKSELYKAGAKEFVQKPYDIDELLKKIRDILDLK